MKKQPEKPELVYLYGELLVRILWDTAVSLGLDSNAFEKDVMSIRERIATTGITFLTEELPVLGKALDRALAKDTNLVVPPEFKAVRYGSTKIPVFLGILWKLIFRRDGKLKDCDADDADLRLYSRLKPFFHWEGSSDAQVVAVRAVRQVCYLGYKLKYPYTSDQEHAKIDSFIGIDAELPEVDSYVELSTNAYSALESANVLISYVLRGLNPARITPKHGPGSVATGEKPWGKFSFKRFYPRLDERYSYADYFFFNYGHLCDKYECLEAMEDIPEAISKMCFVPKDSRGPRLISMEPLEIQWIQQGLRQEIVKIIEDPCSITSGLVNFTDQEVNRRLALSASDPKGSDSGLVTLDLSDASDRVSLWLVKMLFPKYIYEHLLACRSGFTLTPYGDVLRLKKFASMGSACCFPVEALVFWALAVGSLVRVARRKDMLHLPEVYVYGDDIILRKEDFDVVRPVFEELRLKFSEDKCSTGRFFRESCGCDAFKGIDVTPVRLKTLLPSGKWSPKALLSYVSYANRFVDTARRYMPQTYEYIRGIVQESRVVPLPDGMQGCTYPLAFCHPNHTADGVTVVNSTFQRSRYNKRLHRKEWKLPIPVPDVVNHADDLDWNHMWKVINLRGDDPFGFHNLMDSGDFTILHIVKLQGTWVSYGSLLA